MSVLLSPLDFVVDSLGPILSDRSRPTKERIELLWAAAKRARDLASSDVVRETFMNLAIEANLIDRSGRWTGTDVRESVRRYGSDDVSHAIQWALRGLNPFGTGPLE
jgi:hypothetical protein